MSKVALTHSERRRSLGAVIASMAATALIYSLTMPLLALVLDHQGVDETLIGLNTAAQALAVFAVAPITPRIITTLGPARTIVWATGASLVMFLLLPVFPNVYLWFPLRFALGAASILLWTAGEAWINQIAEEQTRGRVVAFYAAAISAGFALGPLILAQTGSAGWTPFLVTAAIIAASAVPVFLALRLAPSLEGGPTARLPMFLLLAPTVMLLNLVFAASDGALLTFLPIYGLRIGLDETTSLYLIAVLGIGSIAAQPPIGWLADHMDRRLLLAACVLLMVAGLAMMPIMLPVAHWNWVYIFLFGAAFGGLYTLGVVLLGERFQGADLAAATTVFSVMWGVGSMVGPTIGGAAMDAWGPHGMPLAVALIFLAYLPFPVTSYLMKRRGES